LHIGGVGGVANIDGVEAKDAGIIVFLELFCDARESVFSEEGDIGGCESVVFPFVEGEVCGADFDAVIVERGSVWFEGSGEGFSEGVDFSVGVLRETAEVEVWDLGGIRGEIVHGHIFLMGGRKKPEVV
jgi:hypothetical protein